MTTDRNHDDNLLSIKAFSDTFIASGVTYYDCNSRSFLILRFPAIIKEKFPLTNKQRMAYELRCFPDREKLMEFIEKASEVPLVLSLFKRKCNKKNERDSG